MTRLTFTSTEHPQAQVVAVSGEIDLSNVSAFIGDVLVEGEGEVPAVVLVLDEVTYVDSTGIAALFKLAQDFERQHQPLALVVGASSLIRQLLKISYVQERIPLFDDLQAALDALDAGTVSAPR